MRSHCSGNTDVPKEAQRDLELSKRRALYWNWMALVPPYIAALKPYKPGRNIAEVQRSVRPEARGRAGLERESPGTIAPRGRGDSQRFERPPPLPQQRPGSAREAGGGARHQGRQRDRRQRLGQHHVGYHPNLPGRPGRDSHHGSGFRRISGAGPLPRRGLSHCAVPQLALRSPGPGRVHHRTHQDHLSGQPQQSDRDHLHAPGVRGFLSPRAGTGFDPSGRSLFRLRAGQSALSGFDALPL